LSPGIAVLEYGPVDLYQFAQAIAPPALSAVLEQVKAQGQVARDRIVELNREAAASRLPGAAAARALSG
jgi:hypothetical protein